MIKKINNKLKNLKLSIKNKFWYWYLSLIIYILFLLSIFLGKSEKFKIIFEYNF